MTKGLVIVLGETGKNFAAGMKGGMAYVLDATATFQRTCVIGSSVDLETLADDDVKDLRYWIARHAEETGSPLANRILENFDATIEKFVKVFPREYKRVLGVAGRTRRWVDDVAHALLRAASTLLSTPLRGSTDVAMSGDRHAECVRHVRRTSWSYGFLFERERIPAAVDERVQDWFEIYQDFPRRGADAKARAAWIAAFRSAIQGARLTT